MSTISNIIRAPVLNLGAVNRFSGVYLIKPESVADHVVQTFFIAAQIARIFGKQGIVVNYQILAYKCMIHDMEEAVTCDIPRNIKYHSEETREALSNAAEELLVKMVYDMDIGFMFLNWKRAKNPTIEGNLLKLADILQVVRKIDEEVAMLGNKYMLTVAEGTVGHLQNQLKYFAKVKHGPIFCSLIEEAIDHILLLGVIE